MSEITISAEKLKEYAVLEKNYEQLKKDYEVVSNKAKWLDSEKEKRKELAEKYKNLETELSKFKENEEKYKDFESISEKAQKWEEYQTKTIEERTWKINELKEKLWEEIINQEQDFLDWLDDEKQLAYLTKLAESNNDFNNNPWENNWGWDKPKTISMGDLAKLASENPSEYNTTRDLIDNWEVIIEN